MNDLWQMWNMPTKRTLAPLLRPWMVRIYGLRRLQLCSRRLLTGSYSVSSSDVADKIIQSLLG